MTRQPPSKDKPVAIIEEELDRVISLGLIKNPVMQAGVAENLRLLAAHHGLVLRALREEKDLS